MARRGDVGDVGVARVGGDLGDVAGVLEPHVRPGLAGVSSSPQPVAPAGAVAVGGLAGTHPDHVRVGLEEDRRADGACAAAVVEDRIPGHAGVVAQEDPARGRPHQHHPVVVIERVDRGDPAHHVGGPDVAPTQVADHVGAVLEANGQPGHGSDGDRQQEEREQYGGPFHQEVSGSGRVREVQR